MPQAHMFGDNWRRAVVNNYFNLTDPGDAGEIWPQIRNPLDLALISGGSGETRKLFPPPAAGLEMTIYMDTDGGGDITFYFRNQADSGYLVCDLSSNNTITFANAGESVRLKSFKMGSSYLWRVQGAANGALLSAT